ncbi:MAG TPA: HemK/PrmC family methyltransferase [Candidatus Binatia bacterium]|nr:HemK/PrmC family methyltransferase [Candidatus Binatia bacterium]
MPLPDRTIGDALLDGARRLRAAESPTARLDAEVLLAHVMGSERSWLLAHSDEPLAAADDFEAVLARRAGGEPVAYIRGFKEWRSLRIRTDARALIPRPETELLAEAAIAEIAGRLARDGAPVVAWEVATGSGAVSVVLALRFRQSLSLGRLSLIASDVSPDALELAAENLAAHGVEPLVSLACADLLAPAGGSVPAPDVVVANLPYVSSDEVDAHRGSLGHEPRIALDGGPDGLDLLRRLLSDVTVRAARGAAVLLEIGVDQVDAIRALAPDGATVSIVPDLAGLDRVVRVQLR